MEKSLNFMLTEFKREMGKKFKGKSLLLEGRKYSSIVCYVKLTFKLQRAARKLLQNEESRNINQPSACTLIKPTETQVMSQHHFDKCFHIFHSNFTSLIC